MKLKITLWNQNDYRWKSETMGLPIDTIGRYGCLVTSYANISLFLKESFNPYQLNKIIKDVKGYAKLNYEGTADNMASNLLNFAIEKILNIKSENLPAFDYDEKAFYIGMINLCLPSGKLETHYINILEFTKESVKIFDVWDGTIRTINPKEIMRYKKVKPC
jgi:hypothetical protein